mgnify:CR=1 FL=1
MTEPAAQFRYVSSDRRVREDRRFVVGKGRFAADIALPGLRHVALVTCPYPAARITGIDTSAALAMPGVHYVLDGRELAEATMPLAASSRRKRALRACQPRSVTAWTVLPLTAASMSASRQRPALSIMCA